MLKETVRAGGWGEEETEKAVTTKAQRHKEFLINVIPAKAEIQHRFFKQLNEVSMSNDTLNLIQAIINALTFVAAIIAAFLAWRIGKKQNEINQQALNIQNFVETFVMPQQIVDTNNQVLGHNLLVKNASSYPIYLNRFTFNGIAHLIGNNAIPVGDNHWYSIPIPDGIKSELSLELEFEDYLGNKYMSRHYGKFENSFWNIRSEKRIQIGS